MTTHIIKVDHDPREFRTIKLGIGILQMLEEACNRSGSQRTGSQREASFRSIARQLAAVRAAPE